MLFGRLPTPAKAAHWVLMCISAFTLITVIACGITTMSGDDEHTSLIQIDKNGPAHKLVRDGKATSDDLLDESTLSTYQFSDTSKLFQMRATTGFLLAGVAGVIHVASHLIFIMAGKRSTAVTAMGGSLVFTLIYLYFTVTTGNYVLEHMERAQKFDDTQCDLFIQEETELSAMGVDTAVPDSITVQHRMNPRFYIPMYIATVWATVNFLVLIGLAAVPYVRKAAHLIDELDEWDAHDDEDDDAYARWAKTKKGTEPVRRSDLRTTERLRRTYGRDYDASKYVAPPPKYDL
jgi:hypothetical protein